MINFPKKPILRAVLLGTAIVALSGCDPDFRRFGRTGFDTSTAAQNAIAPRPAADARGIISYPGYQVAVARRGDTIENVAARIGLPAGELAAYNAIAPGTNLRDGELLALPRRVAEPPAGPIAVTGGAIDVASIATGAINRVDPDSAAPVSTSPAKPLAAEPIRHRVVRGETAYSISRLYNVDVRALADWNGLGTDLNVREGQTLLIPVASAKPLPAEPVTVPGEGTPTPTPPSAALPLPDEKTQAAAEPVATPPVPDLGSQKTAASGTAKFALPVQGKIIRGYQKKKNDGIDIAAGAGATVSAAGDGTVAAITKDTEQVPILVIRHDDNLLTVYANIDGIKVAKGAKVKRGQPIATIRASDPAFLHFEVRQGFDSVDPTPYLQ